jgi:hypothetical protein
MMKRLIPILTLVAFIGGGVFLAYSVYKAQTAVPRLLERIFSEDVNERFSAYATQISGRQHLQVARLQRVEVYERTSKAQAFGFNLPEVIVSVSFPVEYNYNVSLTAPWKFEKYKNMIYVFAPELSGQTPAVNISEMKFEIKKGSILRDEEAVREKLQKELTGYLSENSIALRDKVREEARRSIEQFVRNWISTQFEGGSAKLPIQVLFPGESPNSLQSPPSS